MKYIFIFFVLLSGITLKAQTLRVSTQSYEGLNRTD